MIWLIAFFCLQLGVLIGVGLCALCRAGHRETSPENPITPGTIPAEPSEVLSRQQRAETLRLLRLDNPGVPFADDPHDVIL